VVQLHQHTKERSVSNKREQTKEYTRRTVHKLSHDCLQHMRIKERVTVIVMLCLIQTYTAFGE
jgi:hypothetical protein